MAACSWRLQFNKNELETVESAWFGRAVLILFCYFSSALSIFHVLQKQKGRVSFRKEKRILSRSFVGFPSVITLAFCCVFLWHCTWDLPRWQLGDKIPLHTLSSRKICCVAPSHSQTSCCCLWLQGSEVYDSSEIHSGALHAQSANTEK